MSSASIANNKQQEQWFNEYIQGTELYEAATTKWPIIENTANSKPPHWILAHVDEKLDAIVVYQAYNSDIANYAVSEQKFLGCKNFSPTRMTWIKTNFLWMNYRSNWGNKDKNQTNTLAIYLKRTAFERYLSQAVWSKYQPDVYKNETEYKEAVKKAESNEEIAEKGFIRLQWDPDHSPNGKPVQGRRAIQLGLKQVKSFISGEDIVRIVDITQFVSEQYRLLNNDQTYSELRVPIERVFQPEDPKICNHLLLQPAEK